MGERMLKFFIMVAAVVIIGSLITGLNLSIRKKSRDGAATELTDFAAMETNGAVLFGGDSGRGLSAGAGSDEAAGANQNVIFEQTAAGYDTRKENAGQSSSGADMFAETAAASDYRSAADTEKETAEADEEEEAVADTEKDDSDSLAIFQVIESEEEYYTRLEEMDKKLTAKADEAARKTVADQKTAADEMLKFWDDELNAIYQKLRDSLSEEEFRVLRDEERAWIRDRDEAAGKAAAAENYSNSYQSLAYTRSLIRWTKERVYELAEMYYGG